MAVPSYWSHGPIWVGRQDRQKRQERQDLAQEEDLLLAQEEDLLLAQQEDRGIFAAANAAATTRLSVGNEKVFRNFTPEK